jgi:hypothetical protein
MLAASLSWCAAAEGQGQSRTYRLGLLSPSERAPPDLIEALASLGYVVGRNLVIEGHYTAGALDKLPLLAIELAKTRADIIVAVGADAIRSVINATQTIPM